MSTHPPYKAWPQKAIQELNVSLQRLGEWDTYSLSQELLDAEIEKLMLRGVDMEKEVNTLKILRDKVSQYCLQV